MVTGYFIFAKMKLNPLGVLHFIYVNIYNLQMSVPTPANCKRLLMTFGLPRAHGIVYKLYSVSIIFRLCNPNWEPQLLDAGAFHNMQPQLDKLDSCLCFFSSQQPRSCCSPGPMLLSHLQQTLRASLDGTVVWGWSECGSH